MKWRTGSLYLGLIFLALGIAARNYTAITGSEQPAWVNSASWWGVGLAVAGFILWMVPEQLLTIFKIPELRKKIFITLIFLAVYRIGYYVPLPMIDHVGLADKMA